MSTCGRGPPLITGKTIRIALPVLVHSDERKQLRHWHLCVAVVVPALVVSSLQSCCARTPHQGQWKASASKLGGTCSSSRIGRSGSPPGTCCSVTGGSV